MSAALGSPGPLLAPQFFQVKCFAGRAVRSTGMGKNPEAHTVAFQSRDNRSYVILTSYVKFYNCVFS